MNNSFENIKKPWLSVIIPTYNGAQYLSSALQSLISQTELVPRKDQLEILVVDDGSNDSTKPILEDFRQNIIDSSETRFDLRYFFLEHQGNWVANTNFALTQAQGEFVSFLHQDDYWHSQRLFELKKLVEKYPEAVLYLHPSIIVDSSGKVLGTWRCPFPKKTLLLQPAYIMQRLLVQNFISIPAPLFRREILLKVGKLDERLWYTADWKFWLQCAEQGPWVYHPQPLSYFRIHKQSQTIKGAPQLFGFRKQHYSIEKEFTKYFDKYQASKKLARYSNNMNTALAALLKKRKRPIIYALLNGLCLGPLNLLRYLQYSRITERLIPRLRLLLRESIAKQ